MTEQATGMKLVNSAAGLELTGEPEELAESLARGRAEDAALITGIQSRILEGGWPGDIPEEACVELVEGTGFRLLNDDGTPAGRDAIVNLGQKVWDKLVETAELELQDEELSPDVQSWP